MPVEGPTLSAVEFSNHLDRVSAHVQMADAWAQERFRIFPHLSSVSVNFGVAFALQFGLTLTWERETGVK